MYYERTTKEVNMTISKRTNNTGSTGNHGMQEVDMLKRKMIEEKLKEEGSNMSCGCGNGCEFTILSDEKISLREALVLGDHIKDNNLCPFCQTKNGKINFQFCAENQNKIQEFSFEMNDKVYRTIYKPQGYRFFPVDEMDD